MRLHFIGFVLLLASQCRGEPSAGKVGEPEPSPVAILVPAATDGIKTDLRFYGQAAVNGSLDLTASNGFFDRCFEAVEPGAATAGDKPFIGQTFGCLKPTSDPPRGTARWHLWLLKPGEIRATFFLTVPKAEIGHEWVIRLGEEARTLRATESNGDKPQEQTLVFNTRATGRLLFAIDCTQAPPPAGSRVHRVRLEGSALEGASLLRARWRPAAVHARFQAPGSCPSPSMWVFESRSAEKASSYSPMTTGFGYFGTSFQADGTIAAGAGFNFSMWAAGRTATEAPPLLKMPRLIGTGIPQATYGTFGGEGTGVKFFGAVAYPEGADRTIQALRIEPADDGLVTYFGYFFDEKGGRWRLYASAQAPSPSAKSRNIGVLDSAGSFCEVPGPPNRERSGDLVRRIERRGWFFGKDRKWYRALPADAGKHPPDDPEAKQDEGPITNRLVECTDNFAQGGWVALSTGGIVHHLAHPSNRKPEEATEDPPLPDYLQPAMTEQLFALPVEFGESRVEEAGAGTVTVVCDLRKIGPEARAVLHYGTVDCLTYPAKRVESGSKVEIDMARPERTWQFATPEQAATTGRNRFRLANLKADTTYYFRLFVTHKEGQSWDYHSGHFRTTP